MNLIEKNIHTAIIAAFFAANALVWLFAFAPGRNGMLTVAFLDVGQGDAIFIQAPNGNQVLLDGGPNKAVLRGLSRLMPFYDRSIDVVIASHPDKDHIGGLPDVIGRYNIGIAIEPGVMHGTAVYQALEDSIAKKQIRHIFARRGQRIWLDENVYIEILFPDRDVSGWETNTASIVARLSYGDISFMLTGDSPDAIERYLARRDGKALSSTVLKLGHHGSRTSTTDAFLGFVSPETAIVSAGKNNRYGHPHKEVLDAVGKFGIEILSTVGEGSIIFETDGKKIMRE